jgi:hypothetical protein
MEKLVKYLRTLDEIDYARCSQQDSLKFLSIILNLISKNDPDIMELFSLQYLLKCQNPTCPK